MKPTRKQLWMASLGSVIAISTAACGLFQGQTDNNSQQQVEETTVSNAQMTKFEKLAEEIKNNKPKTIVGEVFENGYLKKHGDHYHFVYGAPPADAIYEQKTSATAISSADDGYVFNPNDIVEENEMGYVVRHGDHFHFIYKNNAQQTLATTMATNSVAHAHHEEVEDGYVFDKKDIVSETESGYIVRHGDHFHFIYKNKQGNPVVTTEHHIHDAEHHNHDEEKHDHEGEHHDHDHDGYVFDKKDIVSETAEGYVVRHGDHFHFIYKNKQGNSVATAEQHHHDADKHDHDGEKHEHEGEHHDHAHDGFVFRKEDIESETESGYVVRHGNHFHFVYKDKNGKPILNNHNHDHDGDKHEHEGEHHDHDGDKHDHEGEHHDHESEKHGNEVTSDNHVSTIPNEKDLTEKSPEIQKYLDYITYAYGVERDTIKLESAYKDGKYVGKVFAFQNMEQGQDKTHIHPWAIPLRNFEVPSSDESIDPELRFAQEIASLAKRMGISVKDIRILGDKFEVPHGDHSHSLKIKNIEGAKKYVANKLKEITPTYIAGDLDTKVVENQIESLANKASEKYKTQPVELSRILTSLREIKERLDEKGNSTQGYLELLKQFDEKYIEKASTVTTPELSKEEKALNTLHESVIRMINELELKDYNVTKDELRAAANKAIEAKDMKALEAVRDYVQALQDANKRLGVEGMKYLYFLTQHIQDKPLPFELREKVSDLIGKLSKAKFIPGETGTTEELISPSYFATKEIKKAHENPAEKVDTRVGDKYKAIAKPDDEESMSKLDEMKEFAEMALEQADKDDSVPTSDFREELSEEVKKDLMTPKSKNQASTENNTIPKAEENTSPVASTTAETEKPVVSDKAAETVVPATTTPATTTPATTTPATATTASQPVTSASEQPHA
ncbi:pneumococcal-type histidine triad protein [uncultured Granulicatella sp.]|uniref:pneumococcal-type histidine triad protein n=1 Tax=uncultured Granulicatella sp. TaxID=316089 RepID=UPI0028D18E3B|nr:pneumococcal-type histidine triad protein [uncultured Granulicatella sp.]